MKDLTPEQLRDAVALALAIEIKAMEDGDLTEARMSRAEFYLAWLRGDNEHAS